MVRLKLPPSSGNRVEVLGHGPEAAPAVVDVLQGLGVI
jgi:electron transfer flavoprotein beta subunit